MPTTPFPVNPELSAVAIGYKNRDVDLIADQVMPRIPKGAQQFIYTKYSAADAFTVPTTLVGRKSEPTVVEFGGTSVTDMCFDYGLDDIVPNNDIRAFEAMQRPSVGGPVNPLVKAAAGVTSLILLDREIRVAGIVFAAGTYPAGNKVTLAGTSQWSDFTNSNPVDAIMASLDVPLNRPNVLTFGQAVWTKVRQHPKVVQAVYGAATSAGLVSREQFAQLLEVKKIVVGAGWVNTARKGQPATMARVWGKHCAALFVSEDLADADQPTFGFTAQFGERVAGDIAEPKMGLRGSVRVRVGESVKEVVADAASAYFFENAIA